MWVLLVSGSLCVAYATQATSTAQPLSSSSNYNSTDFVDVDQTHQWETVFGTGRAGGIHFHHGFFDESVSHERSEEFNAALDRAVEALLPWIPFGARVLDIGSGWCGPLAMLEDSHNCSVVGVTPYENEQAYCVQQNRTVVLGDASDPNTFITIDRLGGKYNVAMLLESYGHITNRTVLLRQLVDRADRLVLRVNMRGDGSAPHSAFGNTMYPPSRQELRQELDNAGWIIKSWIDQRSIAARMLFELRHRLRSSPPGLNLCTSNRLSLLMNLTEHVTSVSQDSHPLVDVVAVKRIPSESFRIEQQPVERCTNSLDVAADALRRFLRNGTEHGEIVPYVTQNMTDHQLLHLGFTDLFECVIDELHGVVESTRELLAEGRLSGTCPDVNFWLKSFKMSVKAHAERGQATASFNRYTFSIPPILGAHSANTRRYVVSRCLKSTLLSPAEVNHAVSRIEAQNQVEVGVNWPSIAVADATSITPSGKLYISSHTGSDLSHISSWEWSLGSVLATQREYSLVPMSFCGENAPVNDAFKLESRFVQLPEIISCWEVNRFNTSTVKYDLRLRNPLPLSEFCKYTALSVCDYPLATNLIRGEQEISNVGLRGYLAVMVVSVQSSGFSLYYGWQHKPKKSGSPPGQRFSSSSTFAHNANDVQDTSLLRLPKAFRIPSDMGLDSLFGQTGNQIFFRKYLIEHMHFRHTNTLVHLSSIDIQSLVASALRRQRLGFRTIDLNSAGRAIPRNVLDPGIVTDSATLLQIIKNEGYNEIQRKIGTNGSAMSMVLRNVEQYSQHPQLNWIRDVITDATGLKAGINMYMSASGSTALRPHTDPYDVIAFQVAGSKKWHICLPNPKNKSNSSTAPFSEADAAQLRELQRQTPLGCVVNEFALSEPDLLCSNTTLLAGDILYLPKSTVHGAVAVGQELSIHLTVSLIREDVTWHALFKECCRLLEGLTAWQCRQGLEVLSKNAPMGVAWQRPFPMHLVGPSYRDSTALSAVKEHFEVLHTQLRNTANNSYLNIHWKQLWDAAVYRHPLTKDMNNASFYERRRRSITCTAADRFTCPAGQRAPYVITGGLDRSCDKCNGNCNGCDYLGTSCDTSCDSDCNQNCDHYSSCNVDCSVCNCNAGQFLSGCGGGSTGSCQTCRTCSTGQYISRQCSRFDNTQCSTCANNVCSGDRYRIGTCSGTTNGFLCSACRNSVCPIGQFRSGSCGTASNPTLNNYACTPCSFSFCGLNRRRLGTCSGTNNGYNCSSCSGCATNEYKIGGCDGVNDTACSPLTPCQNGTEYESIAPTPTTDRTCTALTDCIPPNEFVVYDPTATSDRICGTTTNCSFPSQFEFVAPTATSNRQCRRVSSVCNAQFEYEEQAPTPTSDRVCRPCNNIICPSNHFREPGFCSNVTLGYNCSVCANFECPNPNQYRSGLCGNFAGSLPNLYTTSNNNFQCLNCSNMTCPSEQYQTGECPGRYGRTNGFQCLPCLNSVCSDGWYRVGSCTGRLNNYFCVPCGNASCSAFPGTYRTGTCSETTGAYTCTTCDNITCPSGLYRNGTCSGTVNTFSCLEVTNCAAGSYVAVPQTNVSDAQCLTCPEDSWSALPNSPTCIPAITCPAGSYESIPPTLTSDRACSPCRNGTYQPDSESDTSLCEPFTECPAGTYVSVSGTSSSDRECELCQPCLSCNSTSRLPIPEDLFRRICIPQNASCSATFSSAANQIGCSQAVVSCPPNHYMDAAATLSSDATCVSSIVQEESSSSTSVVVILLLCAVVISLIALLFVWRQNSQKAESLRKSVESNNDTSMLRNPAFADSKSIHEYAVLGTERPVAARVYSKRTNKIYEVPINNDVSIQYDVAIDQPVSDNSYGVFKQIDDDDMVMPVYRSASSSAQQSNNQRKVHQGYTQVSKQP